MNKRPKKGDIVETSLIPCIKCNERHGLVYLGHSLYSWEMNGHPLQEIPARAYIQQQRDFINRLLRTNRRLKSKIYKLEKVIEA